MIPWRRSSTMSYDKKPTYDPKVTLGRSSLWPHLRVPSWLLGPHLHPWIQQYQTQRRCSLDPLDWHGHIVLQHRTVGLGNQDGGWYTTWSIPRCPLRSHSLVCIENHLFIVGIGPIINKYLEFIFWSDRSDRACVYT